MKPETTQTHSIPIIEQIETDSFGTKTLVLRHDNGEREVLTADEGQHWTLRVILQERGII